MLDFAVIVSHLSFFSQFHTIFESSFKRDAGFPTLCRHCPSFYLFDCRKRLRDFMVCRTRFEIDDDPLKTRKEAKQMVTRDSISATKARVEELKRNMEVQRARKDEYALIISQLSLGDFLSLNWLIFTSSGTTHLMLSSNIFVRFMNLIDIPSCFLPCLLS